jgi:lysozyme family protein
MANFSESILKVLRSEGGYSNDPDDSGGETYRGISRKNWPKWLGWLLIDEFKKGNDFLHRIKTDAFLYNSVVDFYKVNFWDMIGGDKLTNQDIADLLVDSAVNEGVKPAVKRAQSIVGLPETGKINEELIEKLCALS